MIKFRLICLSAIFFVFFGVILFRAFQLQILPYKKVEKLAQRQFRQKVEIAGRRGIVLDRHGKELAISTNSLSVFANPKLIQRPARVAKSLARVLGLDEAILRQKLQDSGDKKFVWIDRQLDDTQMKRLEGFDLKQVPGLGVLPEYRREYPHAKLASHILGFVSVDGQGLEGVEKRFNPNLQGDKNTVTLKKDALGRPLFTQKDQIQLDRAQGARIELTIDSNLQFVAERSLHQAVTKYQAVGGTAIVMDPHTGEVLALANEPSYDPNHVGSFAMASRKNRALTDPIEPGSVVKPFVVARALEDKIVNVNTQLSGGDGSIRVGKKVIREAEVKHHFTTISVEDIIRVSSNVGTVVLQQKMGFERVQDVFQKIGFGAQTGIDLQGESRGLFSKLNKNQILEQATMAFGQGFGATPLQIANAYCVLANGGFKVKPRIVKRILNEDSEGEYREQGNAPEASRVQIFSAATVEKMRKILERVVRDEGTGTLAKVEGFTVAGKTGTSQKVDYKKGGYQAGAYWASFVGYLPSENPRFVIYVMVDEPKGGNYFGGQVAAPVFAEIATTAIRRIQSPAAFKLASNKSTESKKPSPKNPKASAGPSEGLPDLRGLSVTQAFRSLKGVAYPVEILGEGDHVDNQMLEQKVLYLWLR